MQRRQRAHTTRHLRSKDKERGARVALADIAATALGTQVYRVGTSERVGTGASGDGRVPEGACRGTALLMTGTSGGDKTLQVGERHAQSGRVGLDAVPSLFVPRAGVAHVSAHATERHGAPRGGVYVCGGIFSKNTGALIQAGCGGARGELRVRWLRR